ncbi:MAG: F0F1 ATP synthase subunit A [Planctomycetes bacterium]|nr:F0F1 ATP synthase subunit A [Planctomycetota bacterium]
MSEKQPTRSSWSGWPAWSGWRLGPALASLLLAVLCLAGSVRAQQAEAPPHDGPPAAPQHAEQQHRKKLTLEMANNEFFAWQFEHSVPYMIFDPGIGPKYTRKDGKQESLLAVYNIQPWQWVAVGLMLVLFLPVVASFRRASVGRVTRILRGFCLWIRDEMVYRVMGREDGRPFVPYFLFVFFFIALQNCIGLIPSVGHGFPSAIYTATGTPYVTGALALVTLLMMLGFGMKKNGVVGFWKGLVPHVPWPLFPMMFVVELIGLCVKPFALTVRLFANMLAGHLVIGSAIGLIFLFTKMQGGAITSYLTAVPCVGLAVFIYAIEAFVTLLQAYIFTFLSITFVHLAMHQEH